MENECEALPGVAYPGVRDNRSTLNTKTGYDDDASWQNVWLCLTTASAQCLHLSERFFHSCLFTRPVFERTFRVGPVVFPGSMSSKEEPLWTAGARVIPGRMSPSRQCPSTV